MSVVVMIVIASFALAVRALVLLRRRAGWERLWRFAWWPLTVELLRRVELARFDRDSQEFPQPRETRLLAMSLAGIPLWSQRAIVGLPPQAEGRLSAIAADEFDHLFVGEFRRRWPARRRAAGVLLAGPR